MKKSTLLTIFVTLSALCAVPAVSHATLFTVEPGSGFTVGIYDGDPANGGILLGSDITVLTGSVEIDVTKDAAGVATQVDFGPNPGSPISWSDWSITTLAGDVYSGTGTGSTLAGSSSVSGGTFSGSTVDHIVNQGIENYNGVMFDLAAGPVTLNPEDGTITTALAAAGGCDIELPFAISQQVFANDDLYFTLNGSILLNGDCCVPEPNGLAIMMVGLVGMLRLRKRS